MKNFLKENWFKILIILILLFLAIFWLQIRFKEYVLKTKKYRLESCINGGRYTILSTGEGLSNMKHEWWAGRWNFEREECEKEEGKYGERGVAK